MSSVVRDLLSGLEKRDASLFAAVCRQIQGPAGERREVWRQLISVFREADAHDAELAIDALRFSGLVLDSDCYDELVTAVEKRFPKDEMASLAVAYSGSPSNPSKELLKRLRLLRSTFRAVLRTADPRGRMFVRRVEDDIAGTTLGRRVAEWRGRGGSP